MNQPFFAQFCLLVMALHQIQVSCASSPRASSLSSIHSHSSSDASSSSSTNSEVSSRKRKRDDDRHEASLTTPLPYPMHQKIAEQERLRLKTCRALHNQYSAWIELALSKAAKIAPTTYELAMLQLTPEQETKLAHVRQEVANIPLTPQETADLQLLCQATKQLELTPQQMKQLTAYHERELQQQTQIFQGMQTVRIQAMMHFLQPIEYQYDRKRYVIDQNALSQMILKTLMQHQKIVLQHDEIPDCAAAIAVQLIPTDRDDHFQICLTLNVTDCPELTSVFGPIKILVVDPHQAPD